MLNPLSQRSQSLVNQALASVALVAIRLMPRRALQPLLGLDRDRGHWRQSLWLRALSLLLPPLHLAPSLAPSLEGGGAARRHSLFRFVSRRLGLLVTMLQPLLALALMRGRRPSPWWRQLRCWTMRLPPHLMLLGGGGGVAMRRLLFHLPRRRRTRPLVLRVVVRLRCGRPCLPRCQLTCFQQRGFLPRGCHLWALCGRARPSSRAAMGLSLGRGAVAPFGCCLIVRSLLAPRLAYAGLGAPSPVFLPYAIYNICFMSLDVAAYRYQRTYCSLLACLKPR